MHKPSKRPRVENITPPKDGPTQPLLATYLAKMALPALFAGIESEPNDEIDMLQAMTRSNDLEGLNNWYKSNKNHPNIELLFIIRAHLRENGLDIKVERNMRARRINALLERQTRP